MIRKLLDSILCDPWINFHFHKWNYACGRRKGEDYREWYCVYCGKTKKYGGK